MNTRELRHRLGRIAGAAFTLAALSLAGCDEVLDVNDPDRVNPGTLENPDVLDYVITGARGDFTEAYSGDGDDSFLSVTGVMSDEFFSSGTFATRTATDRRNQFQPADGNTSDDAYIRLQKARWALKEAAAKIVEFRDTSDPAYGELKALEAYTYVALGEAWCSAVPISASEGTEFLYGPTKSSMELFADADSIFDEALATGAGDVAAVGKARALLNLGRYDDAAAAASGVPTTYNYFIHHSDAAFNNPIYSLQGNGRYSVSNNEGGNGLAFRAADDPRAPWIRDPEQPDGFDEAYALYKTLKYQAFTAPVVLASGVEARLIEAEAALQNDDFGNWIAILNDLREDVGELMAAQVPGYDDVVSDPALAPLADPGNDPARRDLMFSERAFWMYLTGHRLGDLRRLVKQYSMAETDVYPSGSYHKGGSYGDDVIFPVDFDETNNPNFDLASCDVESAS